MRLRQIKKVLPGYKKQFYHSQQASDGLFRSTTGLSFERKKNVLWYACIVLSIRISRNYNHYNLNLKFLTSFLDKEKGACVNYKT